jgi:hypothetical protein
MPAEGGRYYAVVAMRFPRGYLVRALRGSLCQGHHPLMDVPI